MIQLHNTEPCWYRLVIGLAGRLQRHKPPGAPLKAGVRLHLKFSPLTANPFLLLNERTTRRCLASKLGTLLRSTILVTYKKLMILSWVVLIWVLEDYERIKLWNWTSNLNHYVGKKYRRRKITTDLRISCINIDGIASLKWTLQNQSVSDRYTISTCVQNTFDLEVTIDQSMDKAISQ